MPPRRAASAQPAPAPVRHSRRLQKDDKDDLSPLRVLETPKRKPRRVKKVAKKEPNAASAVPDNTDNNNHNDDNAQSQTSHTSDSDHSHASDDDAPMKLPDSQHQPAIVPSEPEESVVEAPQNLSAADASTSQDSQDGSSEDSQTSFNSEQATKTSVSDIGTETLETLEKDTDAPMVASSAHPETHVTLEDAAARVVPSNTANDESPEVSEDETATPVRVEVPHSSAGPNIRTQLKRSAPSEGPIDLLDIERRAKKHRSVPASPAFQKITAREILDTYSIPQPRRRRRVRRSSPPLFDPPSHRTIDPVSKRYAELRVQEQREIAQIPIWDALSRHVSLSPLALHSHWLTFAQDVRTKYEELRMRAPEYVKASLEAAANASRLDLESNIAATEAFDSRNSGSQSPTRGATSTSAPQTPGSTRFGLSTLFGSIGAMFSRFPGRAQSTTEQSSQPPQENRPLTSPEAPQRMDQDQERRTTHLTPKAAEDSREERPASAFSTGSILPVYDREPVTPTLSIVRSPGATEGQDEAWMATPTPAPHTGVTTTNFDPDHSQARSAVKTPAKPRVDFKARRLRMQKRAEELEAKAKAAARAQQEQENLRIKQRQDREVAWFNAHPVPFPLLRRLNAKRNAGEIRGIKRKFRVDDLEDIPPREDGGFYHPSDYIVEEDDEVEYVYLSDKGYLLHPNDPDYPDWESTVISAKRVRFAESLETGPTTTPTWSAGPSTPARTGSLNEAALLTSAMKKTPVQLASGTSHSKSNVETANGNLASTHTMGSTAGEDMNDPEMTASEDRVRAIQALSPEERKAAYEKQAHIQRTTGDPHHAPYLGIMFADPSPDYLRNAFRPASSPVTRLDSGNGDTRAAARGAAGSTRPKPEESRFTGTFTVPDETDSEPEDEENASENEESSPPKFDLMNRNIFNTSGVSSSIAPSNSSAASKTPSTGSPASKSPPNAASASKEANPDMVKSWPSPYWPRPDDPNDRGSQDVTPQKSDTPQIDSEALARARSQAEKYKPKTPSLLRASSRLSSSPGRSDKADAPGGSSLAVNSTGVTNAGTTSDTMTANALTPDTSPPDSPPTPTDGAPVALPGLPATGSDGQNQQNMQDSLDATKPTQFADVPASDFVWPTPKASRWAKPVDPEVQAALEAHMAGPEWEAECNAAWRECWKTWKEELAAGLHRQSGNPS